MEKIPSQQSHSAAQSSDATSTPYIYVENGIYMTKVQHDGQQYRLGATTPRFMQELSSVPMQPSPEDVEALRGKGLWLEPEQQGAQGPKVGITCGGVGSVWPGMGRALYDTFPAAREAMDRLAAVASWDILSLMDETDMEKIQCTRWQMPYLFFVEYAQAAYLQSLGFAPRLMSGHSLGELIGLCLAGTYSPEIAWQIFDRRAVYIDGLEREGKDGMGMMAVYGAYEKVQKILDMFPEVHISNHNTPTQFILGGKKEMLAEARRILRKEKCPALTLPINMAFHHPHLRVLRQSAVDGLMGLPTMVPTIPVLSNVTADLYPSDKEGIVQYIADLDENTVRWVDCVRTMWDRFDIRHFVEFGSADNICGLVKEIEPRAICIPVSLKNAEVQTMRAAVAQLYALGHIPVKNLTAVQQLPTVPTLPMEEQQEKAQEAGQESALEEKTVACESAENIPAHVQDILPILADAANKPLETLRPHMDLRHELALRSNRFPSIMMKVEQLFGIRLRLEDVLHVATILDLANVVARLRLERGEEGLVFEESALQLKGQEQSTKPSVDIKTVSPLQCLRGKLSTKGAVLHWENMPWPSVLSEHVEKKTILVLCAAQGQELFAALHGLALRACRIIFYAPPISFAHAPTQGTQEYLQALGAHVEIHTQEEFLEELHIDSLLHLVEGAVLKELASPTEIPLLRALEKNILAKSATVGEVLTLLSVQDTGKGAAFTAQPAMESIEKFWQQWTQKQKTEKNIPCPVRMLRIPPVLSAEVFTAQKAQDAQNIQNVMSMQELAVYFTRWFWCAKESHGLWQRAQEEKVSLQENLSWQGQIYPTSYTLAPAKNEEGAYAEYIQSQCYFSSYAMPAALPKASAERAPSLTTEHFLSSLYAGVTLPFPWLFCVGMDAVEFLPQAVSAVTEGPEGVTREGRIETYAEFCQPLKQESNPVTEQKCTVELVLRALSAHGRAQDVWQKAAGAHMLLRAQSVSPDALWEQQGQGHCVEQQALWQDYRKGKKFAKKDALRYIGVSKLLELLQEAVQNTRSVSIPLTLHSIEQLRWCASLEERSMVKSGDAGVASAEKACEHSELKVTLQWNVLLEEAQRLSLDVQILCPEGTVLLTAKNISFIL